MKNNIDFKKMWVYVHAADFLIHLGPICCKIGVNINPAMFDEVDKAIKNTLFGASCESNISAIIGQKSTEVSDLVRFFKEGMEKEVRAYNQALPEEKEALYNKLYSRYSLNN